MDKHQERLLTFKEFRMISLIFGVIALIGGLGTVWIKFLNKVGILALIFSAILLITYLGLSIIIAYEERKK